MKKFAYSVLSIALATSLAACGGGDKDDDNNNHHEPTTALGQFVDSAVEGVEVLQNDKSLGVTNSMGQFHYTINGGDLTFKIGKLTLGSSPAQLYVTPEDLTDNVTKQTEIMQILQTLDSDNNPNNGIKITQAQTDNLSKLEHPINFVDSNLSPAAVVETAEPTKTTIISPTQAREHFAKTKETVTTDITSTLSGYWKSDCLNEGEVSSITFGKLTKVNGPYMSADKLVHWYATPNCVGTYQIEKQDEQSNVIDGEAKITVIANNQFTVEYEEYGQPIKEVYKRISEAEYNNANKTKPVQGTSKTDQFVGYWKSTCLNEGSSSSITYQDVTKIDDHYISSQVVDHNYTTTNCTGSHTVKRKTEQYNVTDDREGKITMVSNNQFTVEYTNHGKPIKEVYNRISEKEYPKK